MEGEPEGPCPGPAPENKPDKTHCALISAETKTDSASAKVTRSSLVLGKPAPWSPVARRCRLLPDLPASGVTGHRARPAPLAGIAALLVPHQGAVVAQALRAVPPVPAAPAEVLEAHLVWGRKRETGFSRVSTRQLHLRGSGDSWGRCGAGTEGLREPSHP